MVRSTDAILTLAVFFVVVYVCNVAFLETQEQFEEMDRYCDSQYGDGNWTLVTANESEWDPAFIGNQYVCVPEDSPRAS